MYELCNCYKYVLFLSIQNNRHELKFLANLICICCESKFNDVSKQCALLIPLTQTLLALPHGQLESKLIEPMHMYCLQY